MFALALSFGESKIVIVKGGGAREGVLGGGGVCLWFWCLVSGVGNGATA